MKSYRNMLIVLFGLMSNIFSFPSYAKEVTYFIKNIYSEPLWFSTSTKGDDQSCQHSSNPSNFWLKPDQSQELHMTVRDDPICYDKPSSLRYWVYKGYEENKLGSAKITVPVICETWHQPQTCRKYIPQAKFNYEDLNKYIKMEKP